MSTISEHTPAPPAGAQRVQYMNVQAPLPFLREGKPADGYNILRPRVLAATGYDFLSKLGDMARFPDFHSTKPGVAERSRHKCFDAFDYDQSFPHFFLVREDRAGRTYFRTYLEVAPGHVSADPLNKQQTLVDWKNKKHTGLFFDFTQAAQEAGFERIPAWQGWTRGEWNYLEFWHYQCTENLTFNEAMSIVYGNHESPAQAKQTAPSRIYSLNDRGEDVRNIQRRLFDKGYLAISQVDATFGSHTFEAVKKYQEAKSLFVDGRVGPMTYAALFN